MKFAKIFGALLFAIMAGFLFIVNYSSVASSYECTGEITSGEGSVPKTVFILLEEYRWWIGLWSDSDGSLHLETPNKHLDYYSHLVEVGNQLQIYDSSKEMKGHFSTLSKALSLKTPYGFFEGKCAGVK